MDRMDGLETIRRLLQAFPQAKIIAMSGGSTLLPEDYLKEFLSGYFECSRPSWRAGGGIQKPFTLSAQSGAC